MASEPTIEMIVRPSDGWIVFEWHSDIEVLYTADMDPEPFSSDLWERVKHSVLGSGGRLSIGGPIYKGCFLVRM